MHSKISCESELQRSDRQAYNRSRVRMVMMRAKDTTEQLAQDMFGRLVGHVLLRLMQPLANVLPHVYSYKMTEKEILRLVKRRIAASASDAEAARSLGVSRQYLCDYLKGRKGAGPRILRKLGIRREVQYVPR